MKQKLINSNKIESNSLASFFFKATSLPSIKKKSNPKRSNTHF